MSNEESKINLRTGFAPFEGDYDGVEWSKALWWEVAKREGGLKTFMMKNCDCIADCGRI